MKRNPLSISFICLLIFVVSTVATTFAVVSIKSNESEKLQQELAQATSNSPRTGTILTKSVPETTLENMTLEQKVGQLFILGFKFDEQGEDMLELSSAAKQTINYCKPGGIILTGFNMSTPPQTTQFISDAKNAYSEYPLFVSIDEEGGDISRLNLIGTFSEDERIPAPLEIAQNETPQDAYDYMATIAIELKELGFNLDFAPSCDIFSNPENTVIANRAYGTTAEQVVKFIPSAIKGLTDNGIIAVAKHFPGHGDTITDTHYGLASVDHDLERLREFEFVPFEAAIESGVDMIMTAHILTENATENDMPATMNQQLITDILKGELGFEGVVVTDALDMDAITLNYSSGDAAVACVQAGVDILLMPEDPKEAYEAILEAVETGEISVETIEQSVLKILELKYKYGILK